MLTLLFLGAVLVLAAVAQNQVNITVCDGEPSISRVTYDYDFSGGTVCAMSNSTNIGQPFVFSPRDRTENGSYTVTRINGLSFKVCVFNNGIDLSVTNLNGSGTFNVTFISQGRSVTLPVDYDPQGFYNEVPEQTLPSMEPIWRAFGIRDFVSLRVCQDNGNSLVNISFLEVNADKIQTCLNGKGDIDPLYIRLRLKENASNVVTNQPLLVRLVSGSCENPSIMSNLITITIQNAATTIMAPSVTPTPSPMVTASTTVTVGIGGGGIAGITLGTSALLVLMFVGLLLGICHLKQSTRKSHSCRESSFTSPEEGGGQSLDNKPEMKRVEEGVEMVNLEQPVQNLTNTPQQQLPRDTPPPLSQPSPTTNKSIVVVTPFLELAKELCIKHGGVTLHHVKLDEKARVLNGYSQHIYSALNDNNCELVYFIWRRSIEEASKVTDPPVSDLVRELVARPHSATELQKVVFVQLGSKSAVPLSTLIHQFSLEPSPSDENFNVQECANSIYDMANDLLRSDELQRSDDVNAVDGLTQRTARMVPSEVTPTETLPPRNNTLPPSSLPPSYDAATNTGNLQSSSLSAIGPLRNVEQLRTSESAGSSPQIEHLHIMKEQLKTSRELVDAVRDLKYQVAESSDRQGDKVARAFKDDKMAVVNRLDEVKTKMESVDDKVDLVKNQVHSVDEKVGVVDAEVKKLKGQTEKLQATVEEADTHIQQVQDNVQDLGECLDEAILVEEPLRENQHS